MVPNCDSSFCTPVGVARVCRFVLIWLKKFCSVVWIEAAGVLAACVAAAAGLAISVAAVNGVTCDAVAEDPA